MANLRIQGYPGIGRGANDSDIQIICGPTTEEQVVLIGAAARSAAFDPRTRVVCVQAEAICAIRLDSPATVVPPGSNGDASATTSKRMVAGQTEYFRVNPAAGDYISVISTT